MIELSRCWHSKLEMVTTKEKTTAVRGVVEEERVEVEAAVGAKAEADIITRSIRLRRKPAHMRDRRQSVEIKARSLNTRNKEKV